MIFHISNGSVILNNNLKINLNVTSPSINTLYHTEKYGFEICPNDIENYFAHILIWEYILKNKIKEPCIIIENNVKLRSTYKSIINDIKHINSDWDLIIPYNKLNQESIGRNEIYPSRLGYYWGSYFYIINGQNIEKILSLKSIKQPLDEEILEASFDNILNTLMIDTEWFDFNEENCLIYQTRSSFFLEKIQRINLWESNQKEQAIQILSYLAHKAKELNIKLFAHAGTLLGIIRHDDIMPWDDDVDLCIDEHEIQLLLNAIKQENIIEYTKQIWHKTGFEYYKFFHKEGEHKKGYDYTFPFIDIWLLFNRDNSIITSDGYEVYYSDYGSGIEHNLYTAPILIPQNYKSILNKMYKNWDKYIKVFSWSHRQKENCINSIIAPIKTNSTGKMINNL